MRDRLRRWAPYMMVAAWWIVLLLVYGPQLMQAD